MAVGPAAQVPLCQPPNGRCAGRWAGHWAGRQIGRKNNRLNPTLGKPVFQNYPLNFCNFFVNSQCFLHFQAWAGQVENTKSAA